MQNLRQTLVAAALVLAAQTTPAQTNPAPTPQVIHIRVDPAVTTGIEGITAFPTIQMALDHAPTVASYGRIILEITPGIYHERIIVTRNHPNITLLGMGKSPADVVITNSLNAKQAGGTFFSHTAEIDGDHFEADNLTFENTAGNTGQAVAAVVRADRALFKHCRFLGHQDTLFADFGRQYYLDSYIEGGVDFIFGNAAAVFDHSELHVNGPGYLTAQSRTTPDQPTGYVILASKVTVDPAIVTAARPFITYLGRPWRPYARVVYIDTDLPYALAPAGWDNWKNPANEATAWFAESNSTGPGARIGTRVPWSHQLTLAEAKRFLPAIFLAQSNAFPAPWNPEAEAADLP